jgi:hypothetical protein
VAGDTNDTWDVFVRDRAEQVTLRVSVGPGGVQANNYSLIASISGDGRLVAFSSTASNLVAGDTNAWGDVFVRDWSAQMTHRVSVASGGGEANHASDGPAISADGRHVSFQSFADNLVAGDTNNTADVFVHDLFG